MASVKIVERAIVAAKREGVRDTHSEGLAEQQEALSQIMPLAVGLNVGGKLGIARHNDHISVAVFRYRLLHLDEVLLDWPIEL